MDRKTLIRKLDDGVAVLRGMLAENDGSTLKTISSSARLGFKSLKTAFEHNEKAQKAMAEIKKEFDELENAVKKGDRKLSAKFLAAVEKNIKKYREKFEGAAPAPKTPVKAKAAKTDAPKAASKAKPASSSAAKKPAATKKPTAAKKPATTPKPAVAKKPVAAKKPMAAQKPATAPKSAVAKKPAPAKKPAAAPKRATAKK